MGATKRLAELYVQDLNQRSVTAYSIVRFGNVLGSSGSVLETWSKQIADGGPITVTDERMTRYLMAINEAAALVIESAALVDPTAPRGEVFLLDMGEPVRIVDLARRFVRLHGLEPVLPGDASPEDCASIGIVFTGVRPGEKLHEELAFDAEAMRPTRHDDINIWMLPTPEPALVNEMLTALSVRNRPSDPDALVAVIRRLVPEMRRPVAA
jgi:FlaA1/EpsC-like NDP-sugar epimerase